ncbi:slipin family protein [Tunicatimonas pelagia]|uniref:slipin family protein n=1 Tax=Tunicatimonas pelagia TaxID=931531 RepID=UPI002666B496|nr:slipin family protein [Tunicatimonas pelagia]WKN46002.1 slipin family protein [Tunicatimonas pelagia]
MRKIISVTPNHQGFLYKKNQLVRVLQPGIYKFWDWQNELAVVMLPTNRRLFVVTNQEVLTRDQVALRFSYFVEYYINDGRKVLAHFDLLNKHNHYHSLYEVEQVVHQYTQVTWREEIAQIDSEQLNEQRSELMREVPTSLKEVVEEYGISIDKLLLRDITFPKNVQNLFAKQLEAKVRAKADLENARTAVATTRALKNASELMKNHEHIKFIQWMETLGKIAENGKHTFFIGENTNGWSK